MAIPKSLLQSGYVSVVDPPKSEFKRVMIGSDGPPGTGKTEFILSAPGPGGIVALDNMIENVVDNSNPPDSRSKDFVFKEVRVPKGEFNNQDKYKPYWEDFRNEVYRLKDTPEVRTIGIDGDNDSWELQRLAEFGTLKGVLELKYDGPNAARRLFYKRLHDCGKIIIATNKVRKLYEYDRDRNGEEMRTDSEGKRVKPEWKGNWERQGFSDMEYLWNIHIRHMYRKASTITQKSGKVKKLDAAFGLRVMMAKVNKDMEGYELWGSDCNFQSLMEAIYPNVSADEWGY